MTMALLIAGIGFLLAGLLAIAFGIPVKEFSFGNTLIVTGVVAACTGAIMLGLWAVVRTLKEVAERIGGLGPAAAATSPAAFPAPSPSAIEGSRDRAGESEGFSFERTQPSTAGAESSAPSPPPWHEDTATRDRARDVLPSPETVAEAAPAAKPRRNLLFSSTSRKERDRAEARVTDPAAPDPRPAPVAPPLAKPAAAAPPATFDDAWPQAERGKTAEGAQRRSGRAPSTFADDAAADRHPPAARQEEQPAVTVLKSGVVDGMAYSLYSDGSIEAQMPEGMMRFASIDELRTHLDQRA